MFLLEDLEARDKPDTTKKIADYIIEPERPGQAIDTMHIFKGVYLTNTESGVKKNTEIRLNQDSEFSLFPYFAKIPRQVHRIIIAGKSGSGKSWVAGMILDQMAETFKDYDIVILSFVPEDESLDRTRGGKKPLRVNLNDETIYETLTPEFFERAVVVFDDIEKSTNKRLLNFLLALRAQMCETSRHFNTNLIMITHDLLQGPVNKVVKAEATGCFIYPAYNQAHQSREFLKKYIGLSKPQIEEIFQLAQTNRWVYLNMLSPTYYITKKQVKLLI